MAGIVGSSDLFASAAASTIGTSTTAEGAAFERAVNDNMEALDLKMAFEVFKTEFNFDLKATELSRNICLITRDEYKLDRDGWEGIYKFNPVTNTTIKVPFFF